MGGPDRGALRVLHVSDCYLPRLGGIETQVHDLARHQLAADPEDGGADVEVITATPRARRNRTRFERIDGVPVHRATADLPYELPVHPRTGREVARLLDSGGRAGRPFDVAHVHTGIVSPFAYAALPVLVRRGVPVVVTVHSMWGQAWPVLAAARVAGARRLTWTAVSDAAAAPVRRALGVEVGVVPNGIDPERWQIPDSERAARRPGDVLIVSVLRLAPRKRPHALLEVLAAVRALVAPEVRLRAVVVGDGPLRRRLEGERDALGLAGWVELPGRLDRSAIRDLYRRADLFVSTTELESFGIAALEARTAGVPVLARAGTGSAEFVLDGVTGVLAPDDDALARAVARLCDDPVARAELTGRVRRDPPAQAWPEVLRRCREVYRASGAAT